LGLLVAREVARRNEQTWSKEGLVLYFCEYAPVKAARESNKIKIPLNPLYNIEHRYVSSKTLQLQWAAVELYMML